MFGFYWKKKVLNDAGHKLFSLVIEQSRMDVFYSELAVEDNLDGRFDLMSLHMSIILQKLDQNKQYSEVDKLKQVFQEIMFDNLDLTLREIGVGDLGVGKKIKVMAEAFYGRMIAYQNLFEVRDYQKMSDALLRNLYRERKVDQKTLKFMAKYVYDQYDFVKNKNMENIMLGKLSFLKPTGTHNG